ncbi:MAG: 30S ribosomal protein S3 [Deltaproteobacteria bacterium]|nr:30S ribosomal protein S3 [Deltaproteobacteria bacterium]
MGQKVHPVSLRLGIITTWRSKWFARKKTYAKLLHEDVKIRKYVKEKHKQAGISRIEIERASERIKVIIHTARPGLLIGRRGADIDRLRDELHDLTGKEVYIDIKEVANPALDAQLTAENIAFQLEKRISFRRAMKKAIAGAMNSRAGGIRIVAGGRLAGAEMARRESYREGKVPLHTLRADIDYGFAEALTTYGLIGVKTWIYRGEILPVKRSLKTGQEAAAAPQAKDTDRKEG